MIFLLQILSPMNKKQRAEFFSLFSDLDYEINELGYKDQETELINDMLFNHFGISMTDEFQLKILTEFILDKNKFNRTKKMVLSGFLL